MINVPYLVLCHHGLGFPDYCRNDSVERGSLVEVFSFGTVVPWHLDEFAHGGASDSLSRMQKVYHPKNDAVARERKLDTAYSYLTAL